MLEFSVICLKLVVEALVEGNVLWVSGHLWLSVAHCHLWLCLLVVGWANSHGWLHWHLLHLSHLVVCWQWSWGWHHLLHVSSDLVEALSFLLCCAILDLCELLETIWHSHSHLHVLLLGHVLILLLWQGLHLLCTLLHLDWHVVLEGLALSELLLEELIDLLSGDGVVLDGLLDVL